MKAMLLNIQRFLAEDEFCEPVQDENGDAAAHEDVCRYLLGLRFLS